MSPHGSFRRRARDAGARLPFHRAGARVRAHRSHRPRSPRTRAQPSTSGCPQMGAPRLGVCQACTGAIGSLAFGIIAGAGGVSVVGRPGFFAVRGRRQRTREQTCARHARAQDGSAAARIAHGVTYRPARTSRPPTSAAATIDRACLPIVDRPHVWSLERARGDLQILEDRRRHAAVSQSASGVRPACSSSAAIPGGRLA